jgi:hypothetical protein
VSVEGDTSMPQSAAAAGMHGTTTTAPDLFVTIRFQSTETGRASSCLQMGGASQLQGLDEAARLAVTRDCASAVCGRTGTGSALHRRLQLQQEEEGGAVCRWCTP